MPTQTELWDARPLWESVPLSAIQACLPLFESRLAESSQDSLAHVNGRYDPTSSKNKNSNFSAPTWSRNEDLAACQEGARKLAGLGIGLTPAGDDFLLGVIYGLWLKISTQTCAERVEVDAETQRVVEIIVDAAVARTTTLSGAWLEAAGRGEAGQPWHELVEAMRDRSVTALH